MRSTMHLWGLAAASVAVGLTAGRHTSASIVDMGLLMVIGVLIGGVHLRLLNHMHQQLIAGGLYCAGVVAGSSKFVELLRLWGSSHYRALMAELPELVFQVLMPALLGVLLIQLLAQVLTD